MAKKQKGPKYVFIDFEFNGTAEPYLNLVCCSLRLSDSDKVKSFWLHNNKTIADDLVTWLEGLNEDGYIFVAYAATAEARSFLSLGLDPHAFTWVDLYAEWLQIRYNNNNFQYGRYLKINSVTEDGSFKSAHIRKSRAPSLDKEENVGRDNTETGTSYAGAVAALLGEIVDTAHKTKIRDIIIEADEEEIEEEKDAIIKYCESDLVHLPGIHEAVTDALVDLTECDVDEVYEWQYCRGRYSATCAKFEAHGIPIDVEAVKNLSRNHWQAVDELVKSLNEVYVFYEKEKDNKKDLKGHWTLKTARFEAWIHENGLEDEWPLTKTCLEQIEEYEANGEYWRGKTLIEGKPPQRRYSAEGDVLKAYRGFPAIEKLYETKKSISNLNWFRLGAVEGEDGEKGFLDYVGSDNRLRTFFGPFGTQTGRNAPPAKRFPFAMSKWLKCIMKPEPGMAITEIDYSNQEFILGAFKSGDKTMIEAYESGDPYLYFAIEAGGAPPDATKETHPKPRKKFKATVLGLQYGMGVEKLAAKLRADTGDASISVEDANELRTLHKETFEDYWDWISFIKTTYQDNDCLILPDGWLLGPHCDRIPSVCNFPIQGLGACIIREACFLAVQRGVGILAPVHDAIYFMHKIGDEATIQIVRECMAEAVDAMVPGCTVRTDTNTHPAGEVWVEDEGRDTYERLKKYLEHHESDDEVLELVINELYKGTEYAETMLNDIINLRRT